MQCIGKAHLIGPAVHIHGVGLGAFGFRQDAQAEGLMTMQQVVTAGGFPHHIQVSGLPGGDFKGPGIGNLSSKRVGHSMQILSEVMD